MAYFHVLCLFLGGYPCAEAYVASTMTILERKESPPYCLELVGNGLARDSSECESISEISGGW